MHKTSAPLLLQPESISGLSVSIPEIDAEHQSVILLANKLNEAIVGHMSAEKIRYCMQSILIDAAKHFAHEEELFEEWAYPGAETHVRKHAEVARALGRIMEHFERGGLDCDWGKEGRQVKEALIGHMLDEDIKYLDFYRAKQAQSGAGKNRDK
jgi:hemerythrin